jgi:universal stress protein A
MSRIQRILVPTDFSPTSDIALQYAIDIAPAGAALHLLHVIDETSLMAAYPDGLYLELPGLRARLIEEGARRLADAATQFAAAQATLTTEVVVGRPAVSIAEAAKTREADLIVMGTHGRGGFAHLMLGSVAERVLRAAPCPVLTVRDHSRTADEIAEELVATRRAGRA